MHCLYVCMMLTLYNQSWLVLARLLFELFTQYLWSYCKTFTHPSLLMSKGNDLTPMVTICRRPDEHEILSNVGLMLGQRRR